MKALVVDDDRVLVDVLAFTLRREGFRVSRAFDGEMALQLWAEERPDLIVLDVNLPKLDGFTVCQRIRKQADTPILLLTVRETEDDIVHGLELGADDYITKPFSPRILAARVKAVLRREAKDARDESSVIHIHDIVIHPGRHEVTVQGNIEFRRGGGARRQDGDEKQGRKAFCQGHGLHRIVLQDVGYFLSQ